MTFNTVLMGIPDVTRKQPNQQTPISLRKDLSICLKAFLVDVEVKKQNKTNPKYIKKKSIILSRLKQPPAEMSFRPILGE